MEKKDQKALKRARDLMEKYPMFNQLIVDNNDSMMRFKKEIHKLSQSDDSAYTMVDADEVYGVLSCFVALMECYKSDYERIKGMADELHRLMSREGLEYKTPEEMLEVLAAKKLLRQGAQA